MRDAVNADGRGRAAAHARPQIGTRCGVVKVHVHFGAQWIDRYRRFRLNRLCGGLAFGSGRRRRGGMGRGQGR